MKHIKHVVTVMTVLVITLTVGLTLFAQNEFAATLEVLNSGVEVQRVNTDTFIAVQVEAIVGVGDTIRTDETGEARITFFADGTDVTLEPSTEYRIIEFEGDDDDFQLTVEVLAGQTTHRLGRILGTNSSYDVETPGMTLAAQGTVFSIRVESNGRSGMLVFEGDVDANADGQQADVPPAFGIRSAVNEELSDVVRASTFDELDSALDGCTVSVTTLDDVSINVRLAPSLDAEAIGFISADEIDTFVGVTESGTWYRIPFDDSFAWVLSSTASISTDCAGLRVFADDFSEAGVSPTTDDADTSDDTTESDEG
ncbi:MAG: FecR domain-containing protein [Chloroflexota bacterium]